MTEGWDRVRLRDVIDIAHGFAFKSDDFSDEPSLPTLVTPGNFGLGGGFQKAKPKTFSGTIPDGYVFSEGDIVVTMTDLSKEGDTLGYSARIPSDATYLHNQRIGRVRVTAPDVVDLAFVHWLLRTAEYRAHVLGSATGSTVRHTSPGRIGEYTAWMPPLSEQRAISSVLDAFDEVAEINGSLASNCDELLTALVAGVVEASTHMASLSSVARFVNGKNFSKDASGTGRPIIRTPEVRMGPRLSTLYADLAANSENLAHPGDVLFVWSGTLQVARWLWDEALVNQHIFKVEPKDDIPGWLVYCLLEAQMDRFLGIASDKATTMGHIKREDLDVPVPFPDAHALTQIGGPADALWAQSLSCRQEARQAQATRNELMPLLMSGRIRVARAGESGTAA